MKFSTLWSSSNIDHQKSIHQKDASANKIPIDNGKTEIRSKRFSITLKADFLGDVAKIDKAIDEFVAAEKDKKEKEEVVKTKKEKKKAEEEDSNGVSDFWLIREGRNSLTSVWKIFFRA